MDLDALDGFVEDGAGALLEEAVAEEAELEHGGALDALLDELLGHAVDYLCCCLFVRVSSYSGRKEGYEKRVSGAFKQS